MIESGPRIEIWGWQMRLSAFADIRIAYGSSPLSTKVDIRSLQPWISIQGRLF